MKLDIFNTACRDLPEGYTLNIELEKDSGSISIADPAGIVSDWHEDDLTFEEQISSAVAWCIAREKPVEPAKKTNAELVSDGTFSGQHYTDFYPNNKPKGE